MRLNFMRTKKEKIVSQLKAEALAFAKNDHNCIRVRFVADKSAVTLTTHCNGQDLAWITYDPHQLDELISLLEQFRAGLKSKRQ